MTDAPTTDASYDAIFTLLIEKGEASPDDIEKLLPPLQAVQKVTPDVLPLAIHYMSTGSPLAQSETAFVLHETLRGITSNLESATKSWWTHEDVWHDRITYYETMPVSAQMTLRWHFYNVASGLHRSMNDLRRIIDILLEDGIPYKDQTEVYWRGVSAFYLALDSATEEHCDDYDEFVQWAGASEELERIVLLAKERGTYSVEELSAIMQQQEDVMPRMREGVL